MATETWVCYFSEAGAPATGLAGGGSAAGVNIWRVSDGVQVVTSGMLVEIGGGWYKYDFATADEDEQYVATFDGDTVSENAERYVPAASLNLRTRLQAREIHQVHGLDVAAPLVVDASTPTGSRDAGADIEQSIITVGNVTTVTRVP